MRHVFPLATTMLLLGACSSLGPTVPGPVSSVLPGAAASSEVPAALASGTATTPTNILAGKPKPGLTPSGAPDIAPPDPDAPPGVDPLASEELVSEAAFEEFRKAREGTELIEPDLNEDREALQREEAEFKAFLAEHPERAADYALSPDPDGQMKMLPNGHLSVRVNVQDGREESMTLLGSEAGIGATVAALRGAQSVEQQVTLYADLFQQLNDEERAAAADSLDNLTDDWLTGKRRLAQSEEQWAPIQAPARFPLPGLTKDLKPDQIARLNWTISLHLGGASRVIKPAIPEGYVSDPAAELGSGSGADRGVSGGSCDTPAPTGLFAKVEWPYKYFTTSVKSQGVRPTSMSFALISALEMTVAQVHRQWANFSEQDFNYKFHTAWWPRGGAGSNDLAATWVKAQGYPAATEAVWEYNPSTTCESYGGITCSETPHQGEVFCMASGINPSGRVCLTASGATTRTSYSAAGYPVNLGSPNSPYMGAGIAQLAVTLGRPVMATFRVTPAFINAPDGYVASDGGAMNFGYASAHVIGFVSKEKLNVSRGNWPPVSGEGYFIIKWSQGACQGDAGYKYVSYDYMVRHCIQWVAVVPQDSTNVVPGG